MMTCLDHELVVFPPVFQAIEHLIIQIEVMKKTLESSLIPRTSMIFSTQLFDSTVYTWDIFENDLQCLLKYSIKV